MGYFGKAKVGRNKEAVRHLENLFTCSTKFDSGGIHVYLNPLADCLGSCSLFNSSKILIAKTKITKLFKSVRQWYIFFYESERIQIKPDKYWLAFTGESDVEAFYDMESGHKIYSIYDNISLSPRATKPVVDIVTLEAIRNVEMSAMGRFYVDESGNAKYESRYARNP